MPFQSWIIPKTEDLFATLGGEQEYTKLDLNQAYQKIELDDESKRYVTINTHKGLSDTIDFLMV